jgi:hypothetical protein
MIEQSAILRKLHFTLKIIPDQTAAIDMDDVITRARETLADTVAPFRWGAEQLAEFAEGGSAELKILRSDAARMNIVHEAFTTAIANYIVYRALALDNDAQNNNGALSDKYYTLFASAASSVPYFFSESELEQFVSETITDLIAKRTDLRISDDGELKTSIISSSAYDLPERFEDTIVYGAAGRAAIHAKNDAASYFFEQYNAGVTNL